MPAVVWRGPARSVHARGEWDGWAQDLVLTQKTAGCDWYAEFPKSWNGMMYKFIVDGTWTVDELQPTQTCCSGHLNNVYPGYKKRVRSSSRSRDVWGEGAPDA